MQNRPPELQTIKSTFLTFLIILFICIISLWIHIFIKFLQCRNYAYFYEVKCNNNF